MQKIILIVVLLCALASNAQTPFDSFDTTMKSVPLFKSERSEKFIITPVDTASTFIKFLELDVSSSALKYFGKNDLLLATVFLKPNDVKFLSVDPLSKQYPMLTPYQFAANRPIDGIDLDGLEFLPFQKSMYRMQYGTGQTQTVSTAYAVVNSVYSNIPTALQDAKAKDFKYVLGGPVTAWGRDWDVNKDGAIITPTGKYWNQLPKFYGLADGGQDPEPTSSTSGMGGAAVNSARNNAANGAAGALGEEGVGVLANQWNRGLVNAFNKEGEYRRGFYNATNVIDNYLSNNKIGGNQLSGAADRSMLINFLADGYLPTSTTDGFTGVEYSSMRREAYGKQLMVAFHGLQIIQQLKSSGIDIDVKSGTKTAVQNLLQKYKADGGGNNYDNITTYTK